MIVPSGVSTSTVWLAIGTIAQFSISGTAASAGRVGSRHAARSGRNQRGTRRSFSWAPHLTRYGEDRSAVTCLYLVRVVEGNLQ